MLSSHKNFPHQTIKIIKNYLNLSYIARHVHYTSSHTKNFPLKTIKIIKKKLFDVKLYRETCTLHLLSHIKFSNEDNQNYKFSA